MLHIGYNNYINETKIVSILSLFTVNGSASAPVKRIITSAEEHNTAIDCTMGHKIKSVIIMTSNHVVLVALAPDTISNRITNKKE